MKSKTLGAMRSFVAVVIGAVITSASASAVAATFTSVLDEFWIVKGTTEIFRDSFNDTILPPSGPDGATTYSVFGAAGFTSEATGKLTMTPSLGDPVAITTTFADVATNALRSLSTNPLDSNFLGQASSFEMHALYDMSSIPTVTGQSFQLRATDRALGLGNEGNNTYALLVGVSSVTGDVVVALRLHDFEADTSTVIESISIQSLLAGADQIELIFSKDAGSNELTASYVIYDINDSVLGSGFVGASTALTIYGGEDYIRAQFTSTDRVAVPAPATIALLALGLAGLRFARRPKRQ